MEFLKKLWDLIQAFDLWILDKFQRFSDLITKKTGIGNANYKIAYFLLTGFIVLGVFNMLIKSSISWIDILFITIYLLIGFIFYSDMKEDIASQKKFEKRIRKNPKKYLMYRMIIYIAFLGNIIRKIANYDPPLKYSGALKKLDYIAFLCFLIFLYFLSCSGLPPQKGKIKNWIKSLLRIGKTAPVKVPTK
jgi:hypothetical protein